MNEREFYKRIEGRDDDEAPIVVESNVVWHESFAFGQKSFDDGMAGFS